MEKLYSIIIPHKNSPDLLLRCINSIPERDDLEILVIDDNSDADKKPLFDKREVTVIRLSADQSNGPGHARNLGIDLAKGKWLLFADADDTYTNRLGEALDKVLESDADVMFYNHNIIEGENIKSKDAAIYCHSDAELFNLQYILTAPWNKIIRSSFIHTYRIRFEECPVGEDLLFSYQVSFFSKDRYIIFPEAVYNYFINPNSITHKKIHNEVYYLTICKHIYQQKEFFHFIGEGRQSKSMFSKTMSILFKSGWQQFRLILITFFRNRKEIEKGKKYFVETIKSHIV